MFAQMSFPISRLLQSLALGAVLAISVGASATVTTSGCASSTSCTGTELSAGGEFSIGGVRFFDFTSVGVFGEAAVRFTPYSDLLNPGFLVTRDGGLPLYRAAGEAVNPVDGVVFNVESDGYRAILRRTLGAEIGEYSDPVSAFIGARTYSNEFGGVDLSAVCFDVLTCANSTLSDTIETGVDGFVALTDYSLDLVAFIGDESDPTNAVVELVAAAFRLQVAPSDDIPFEILSGTDWLCTDTEQADWQTIGFDDSQWIAPRAPYPSPITPDDLIPGTSAQFMWYDPEMLSDGGMGPVRTWYRYPFHVDLPGGLEAQTAIFRGAVDDDYDLYVNGTLVLENHDNGFGDNVDVVDISQYLQDGDNLMAIYAVDGGWVTPRPRGFERVLVDADFVLPRFSLPIRSDGTWLSSDTEQTNWQTVNFDDSAWVNARSNYPSPTEPQTLVPDTLANFIWHDPDMVSDGGMGPDEAFFRYRFVLPFNPAEVPLYALARVNADDDYDLYVNGTLVYRNNDAGFADLVDELEFTAELREGLNVIAIRAADGSGDNPFPRGFERLFFEGLVATGDAAFANDADGDEISNFADNCINSYNPGQTDSNGDGYGNACDADLNGDGVINAGDLGVMKSVFLTTDPDADLNNDGKVNAGDLAIMKQTFFGPPGPSAIAP